MLVNKLLLDYSVIKALWCKYSNYYKTHICNI